MNQQLQEGVRLFNEGAFFEAHEVFEDLWLGAAPEDRKNLFKGLVQVCAALIQHSRNQPEGAIRLMARSLERLEASEAASAGFDLPRLIRELREVQEAARNGKEFTPPAILPPGHL